MGREVGRVDVVPLAAGEPNPGRSSPRVANDGHDRRDGDDSHRQDRLADEGVLRLDDEVRRYVEHPYHPGITVRQLVTHTAGVPNPIPLRWVHAADAQAGFDGHAALAKVLAKHSRPKSRPGERYLYSNIGYWLLGEVVEAASKQDYSAFVRARVFAPLGLSPRDIDFAVVDPGSHAKGYLAAFSVMNALKRLLLDRRVWGGYEGAWLRIRDVYPDGPSFGGAVGSAAAFGVILRDLLRDDPIVLSRASKALLFEQVRLRSGRPIAMTLGWHIGDLEGRPRLGARREAVVLAHGLIVEVLAINDKQYLVYKRQLAG